MTVTVRPAHVEELPSVGELTVTAYGADGYLLQDDPYAAHLRDAATRAREAEVYVAELADRPGGVAGTVTFCPEGSPWCELAQPGEGEFRMLAVAPDARRRGVAEALVSVCLERSRELGYTAVVLSSLPEQQPAHRLYQRLGFRRTPDLDWSPVEGVDLLAFRLDLTDRHPRLVELVET
jgi:ribosomal protein S18 acetylase RimI-like enzyme